MLGLLLAVAGLKKKSAKIAIARTKSKSELRRELNVIES